MGTKKAGTGAQASGTRQTFVHTVAGNNPAVEEKVVHDALSTLDQLHRLGLPRRGYNLESPYSKRAAPANDEHIPLRARRG